MEEVARDVNEGRRRREVVKEVLTGGKGTSDPSTPSQNGSASGLKPKKGLALGVSASVKLVKGMKHPTKAREGADGNEEKDQVEKMEAELKRCGAFIRKFAKETVDWARKIKRVMTSLYAWAEAFGQVTGISTDSVSEAFDAFKMVLRAQIIPVCADLETVVQERLFSQLSLLVDSMNDPLRLLEAMHTLEPLHYGLLNLETSKARPPPSLLEASQSYVALRGQLFAELPQYLKLVHKGITAAIVQLSAWQTTFYKDTQVHWGELWDALRVEEDSSISSAPETMQIWWERFSILEEALGELGILRKPRTSLPSPATAIAKTPTTSSINSTKQTVEGSAFASGRSSQDFETSPPIQYAQYVQHPHQIQLQSPSRPQPTSHNPHSPPQPSPGRRRSGSVPTRVMQALEPDRPVSPAKFSHTANRDSRDGGSERRRQGNLSDVVVPAMEPSQTYPRQLAHQLNSPPNSAAYNYSHHHSPRPPPLPHSNTQPIPSANIPIRRPTHRARSHSRATIEEFRYLGALIREAPLTTQTRAVPPDHTTPGLSRRTSPKRDMGLSGGKVDNGVNRGSYASQHLTVPSNADDTTFVSEVVVLDADSWEEREREVRGGRPKVQRRGSVKKKLADTLENVARRSPSLHSLKRFSGPPRLASPSPSPGLPQSSSQQQGHVRSHSRSRSRPATPHTPSHPTYSTPPIITTSSSSSSHSQGPYLAPVLYACQVISPFHLGRDALYGEYGFHTLDVGMKLGILEEHGHPSTHPSLPVHVDDGEDCLLLAMDRHGYVGWAFASFLVPVD